MTDLLKIAICEDNLKDSEHLLKLIGKKAHCDSFQSGEAMLADFHAGKYDLIFLDIYMSGMKGIDAAEAVRKEDGEVTLCFTTTSIDHALESYRLGALKYIEKPIQPEDVADALRLADLKRQSRQTITLLIAGERRELMLSNILFFESRDHAVQLHTTFGAFRTSQSLSLDEIEKMLPSGGSFLRSHRSYIVNLSHVVSIERDFIMTNGERAYIRSGDEGKCARILKGYLLDRLGRNEAWQ